MSTKIIDYYNRPIDKGVIDECVGQTQQNFKDECDINYIYQRCVTDRAFRPMAKPADLLKFGNFSSAQSYQEVQNQIIEAEDEFQKLRPDIRNRFHGDMSELLEFLNDESNRDEATKLGFIEISASPSPSPLDNKGTTDTNVSQPPKPEAKNEQAK